MKAKVKVLSNQELFSLSAIGGIAVLMLGTLVMLKWNLKIGKGILYAGAFFMSIAIPLLIYSIVFG